MADPIARARAVIEAATPGRWDANDVDVDADTPPDDDNAPGWSHVAVCVDPSDARAIAIEHNALPAMLALVEAARAHMASVDTQAEQMARFYDPTTGPDWDACWAARNATRERMRAALAAVERVLAEEVER